MLNSKEAEKVFTPTEIQFEKALVVYKRLTTEGNPDFLETRDRVIQELNGKLCWRGDALGWQEAAGRVEMFLSDKYPDLNNTYLESLATSVLNYFTPDWLVFCDSEDEETKEKLSEIAERIDSSPGIRLFTLKHLEDV